MTPYMYIATLAWLFLVSGYLSRKRRRAHVTLGLTGIFLDIALVVYLQVTRHAVQTAAAFTLKGLQQMHIGVSTVALVLYFPVLLLGMNLFHDSKNLRLRALHKRIAVTALIFRTLGFLFMFSMLTRFR